MEGEVQEVCWAGSTICFLYIEHLIFCRVFCIGALSITTYNPSTMEATNQWQYSDFITILPAGAPPTVMSKKHFTMMSVVSDF